MDPQTTGVDLLLKRRGDTSRSLMKISTNCTFIAFLLAKCWFFGGVFFQFDYYYFIIDFCW